MTHYRRRTPGMSHSLHRNRGDSAGPGSVARLDGDRRRRGVQRGRRGGLRVSRADRDVRGRRLAAAPAAAVAEQEDRAHDQAGHHDQAQSEEDPLLAATARRLVERARAARGHRGAQPHRVLAVALRGHPGLLRVAVPRGRPLWHPVGRALLGFVVVGRWPLRWFVLWWLFRGWSLWFW